MVINRLFGLIFGTVMVLILAVIVSKGAVPLADTCLAELANVQEAILDGRCQL